MARLVSGLVRRIRRPGRLRARDAVTRLQIDDHSGSVKAESPTEFGLSTLRIRAFYDQVSTHWEMIRRVLPPYIKNYRFDLLGLYAVSTEYPVDSVILTLRFAGEAMEGRRRTDRVCDCRPRVHKIPLEPSDAAFITREDTVRTESAQR